MNSSSCTNSLRKRKIIYKHPLSFEGSYAEVWLVEWGGLRAVAKRISKKYFEIDYDQEIRDHLVAEFMKECEMLRSLDHENIVKMLDVLLPANKSPVLIMELMHCDLQSYINKSTSIPKVSPDKVVSIALGVAKGLQYLHELPKPIIHRDLASKNILLTENGQPKIADLGVSKILLANKDAKATPRPGTPLYAAPETYKNVKNFEAKYGVKADIFSFGVVLLEMNVGHEPRPSPSGKKTEIQRRQMDIDEMQDEILKGIVMDCLEENSKNRPSASKIVSDLGRIKKEREGQMLLSTKPVSFERLNKKPSSPYDHYFKVLLLGNSGVGKSSLFELLRNPTYDISKSKSTIIIQPVVHYFKYNVKTIEMVIVDTSGEERYFSLTSSYYRDVDGVFLVYDISDQVSLRSLPFWIDRLKKYNRKDNFQMLLVGNKVDLRKSKTTDTDVFVPRESAVEYASTIKSPYVETSARDVDSVTAMYQNMVEILMSTVSPEDVNVQVIAKARTTIRLPSSPSQNKSRENKCASSCRKA